MSKPKIDPEIIANIRSAHAMSVFTKYIADYDESLTHVEAMTIATAIV